MRRGAETTRGDDRRGGAAKQMAERGGGAGWWGELPSTPPWYEDATEMGERGGAEEEETAEKDRDSPGDCWAEA